MRVLLTGDIHLGRRSSRIPERFQSVRHSSAAAWGRIVETAVKRRPAALLLAGDLIDEQNAYFESFGPLGEGLQRLAGAGIPVAAVTGNHDAALLTGPNVPQGLRLLGSEGGWEEWLLTTPDGEAVRILGRSWSQGNGRENPLHGFTEPDPGPPVVGVLHGDLDQPSSGYAPVASDELRRWGLAAWVIGHRHRPQLEDTGAGPLILVPGSPQALDPGETGAHGLWELTIEPGRRPEAAFLPLSTIRYDGLPVSVDGESDPDAVRSRVTAGLVEHLNAASREGGPLELVICRVFLSGRTRLHHRLAEYLEPLVRDLAPRQAGVTACIDALRLDTGPEADLQALAESGGLPGALARMLLDLDTDHPSADLSTLLDRVLDVQNTTRQAPAYMPAAMDKPPNRESARASLRRQGYRLLDALLAQKELS